ncbi:uncharacterized protein LOC119866764 isoform X2 [Canis lupus familiaris]|uniref:uncharacterized protein LOC119866764 isoform X2 n=1 Tax=Canis lupus familiaris TaxID=9615 RepID=UPI0018F717EF|nr:uncharacterized protein LOC119866764 isoform X2 [Canis lupus familiaris]
MGGSSGRRAPWVTVAACFPCSAPRWTPLPGGYVSPTKTFEARDARQRDLCKGPEAGAHKAHLRNTEVTMAGAEINGRTRSETAEADRGCCNNSGAWTVAQIRMGMADAAGSGQILRMFKAPELQDGKTRRAFCLLLYPHYSEECLEKVIMFLIRASFREAYRYWITRTLKTASGCPYPMVCSWNPFTNRNCKCS